MPHRAREIPTIGDPHHIEAAIPTTDFTVLDRADHLLESPPGRKYPYLRDSSSSVAMTQHLDDSDAMLPPDSLSGTSTAFTNFDPLEAIPSLLEAVSPEPRTKPSHPPFFQSVDRFSRRSHRVLGSLGVIAITFFVVCGGPVGTEPIVAAGGPVVAIITLLLYPILVTMPYAYVIAELTTAFPEDGGFVVWVLNAFGPFWGFQVGYWCWISGLFYTALLPSFILKIVIQYAHLDIDSSLTKYFIQAAIAVVLCFPTFFGTVSVQRSCVALLGLVLVPAILFVLWGYAASDNWGALSQIRHVDEGEIGLTGPVDIDWNTLLNMLFWRFDGINMAAVFGSEVANPTRIYPTAIKITVGLTMATYIFPMTAAVVISDPHWSTYVADSYIATAMSIGGRVLEKLTIFTSVCGVAGLALAGLFAHATQVCGMADCKLLPSSLAERHRRFDAPHIAIATTLCATLMLLAVEWDHLLPVANVFACGTHLIIMVAAIRLRRFLPFIPRPTQAPGGIWCIALVTLVPIGLMGFLVFYALQKLVTALLIAFLLVPGLLYGTYQQCRSDGEASPVMFA
ncbi:hypothetical protein Poli38472_007275 [Pythium oligandrum]|uniref:Amino acid transporter n=1 Tax=Pythium oligandrum TaxID=41045 RepID=A0A8K1FD73_PYTOL|nr:hypothetical protein Poli38472_007275 [Pythium oligandrum]|eukprot:TMW59130.1 hypothetical protein Poli38472_007275 [Pythium oligandrum]